MVLARGGCKTEFFSIYDVVATADARAQQSLGVRMIANPLSHPTV
jgi:hypothetical protein